MADQGLSKGQDGLRDSGKSMHAGMIIAIRYIRSIKLNIPRVKYRKLSQQFYAMMVAPQNRRNGVIVYTGTISSRLQPHAVPHAGTDDQSSPQFSGFHAVIAWLTQLSTYHHARKPWQNSCKLQRVRVM